MKSLAHRRMLTADLETFSSPGKNWRLIRACVRENKIMLAYGFDSIAPMLEQDGYFFKLIANESGVVFFPHTTEHRDAGQSGLRYEDHSRGNALAAVVKPGSIEFRFHEQFSDGRVRELSRRMFLLPEMEFARSFQITYQARTLVFGRQDS